MAVFSDDQVKDSLKRKGFVQDNGGHQAFIFMYGGKKTGVRTHTSHNGEDVTDGLISSMAVQTRLTRQKFMDLIKCPLDKDEYTRILIHGGHIKPDISR